MEQRDTTAFDTASGRKSVPDPEGRDVVIVDGRAMTYRNYRR